MSDQALSSAETIIPFPNNGDALDQAGHAACDLVQRAAGEAEQKAQHIMGVAHKLSLQLRAAEDRLAALQAEVKHYRDRADRAEKWLHRVAIEIEHKFFASPNGRNSQALQTPTEQANLKNYEPKRRQSS